MDAWLPSRSEKNEKKNSKMRLVLYEWEDDVEIALRHTVRKRKRYPNSIDERERKSLITIALRIWFAFGGTVGMFLMAHIFLIGLGIYLDILVWFPNVGHVIGSLSFEQTALIPGVTRPLLEVGYLLVAVAISLTVQ